MVVTKEDVHPPPQKLLVTGLFFTIQKKNTLNYPFSSFNYTFSPFNFTFSPFNFTFSPFNYTFIPFNFPSSPFNFTSSPFNFTFCPFNNTLIMQFLGRIYLSKIWVTKVCKL